MNATLPASEAICVLTSSRERSSGTQLALGRVARDDGLQHLDVRSAVEKLTDRAEQRGDRRRGAVRLECVRVGPLFDEHEGAVGLVQRVEIATRFGVPRLDGLLTCVPDRVYRLGLGFHGSDNSYEDVRWTPRCVVLTTSA